MKYANMKMHVKDNDVYNVLHPETNSEQVILLSEGISLQEHLDSTVPVKVENGKIKFLNPESGQYEDYSSDTLHLTPLNKINNLSHTIINDKATIKWSDPDNISISTNVKTIEIAKWKGTKLVMKQDSIPADINDGTLLVDSTVKNQFSVNGFDVYDLVYGKTYYIKAFPYTETDIVTNSNDSVISFVPVLAKLDNVSSLASATAGNRIYLKWVDPPNKVGALWAGTKVVMKQGSYPTTSTDGTLIVDSKARDQYSTGLGLTISDLSNDVGYFFGFFPYSTEGVETNSTVRASERTSFEYLTAATGYSVSGITASNNTGTITLRWTEPANKTKTVFGQSIESSIWLNTKVVRKIGSYPANISDGTLVHTNTVRGQGFTDSNLPPGTTYYYTLFISTTDGLVTQTQIGSANIIPLDDTSGSPGAKMLVGGTKSLGYYGRVTQTDFMTYTHVYNSCAADITPAGLPIDNGLGWLKFSLDGKILFVAISHIGYYMEWDGLSYGGVTNGRKTITDKGLTYKVRLLKGLRAEGVDYRDIEGSEWNRLIYPISAKYGPWDNLTDDQLNLSEGTISLMADWAYSNTPGAPVNIAGRQYRVDNPVTKDWLSRDMYNGWRPVLELVQS